jgi:RNA polymerase sigma-70 factor (ECF subfamily)
MEVPPALVSAAALGDRRALDELVGIALPGVLRWCLRLGGPRVDAEDASHEVLVVMLERLHTLREPACFAAWLFQVTRRVLAGHRRRSWFSRWVPAVLVEVVDPDRGPAARLLLSDRARRVQAALEELPEDQREVFVLCELEELTDEAVAGLLGIAVGTAKSRLRLGRERFRRAAIRHGVSPDLVEVDEIRGPILDRGSP